MNGWRVRATELHRRLHLATRNVFRHKLRTSLTLAVIAAGVAGLILSGGFIQDSLHQLREATIHSQLGHLQIHHAGYDAMGRQNPTKYLLENIDRVILAARQLRQVDEVMTRLTFSAVLNNGHADVPIVAVGMEPSKEAKLATAMTVIAGRRLDGSKPDQIMLGEGLAHAAGRKPGDRVTLVTNTAQGALNSLDFDVVGVFRTISREYDSRAAALPIESAQQLLDTNTGNSVVILLKDTDETPLVASKLREQLPAKEFEVTSWDELADFYAKTVALYGREFAVLEVIILVAVLLSVTNSVNMTMFERTGEFGTLLAIGTRRGELIALVLTETCVTGAIGSAIGVLIGIATALILSGIGLPMPPPPNSNAGYLAHIEIAPWEILAAFSIGCVGTALAGIAPAWRLRKIPVVEALRQNA